MERRNPSGPALTTSPRRIRSSNCPEEALSGPSPSRDRTNYCLLFRKTTEAKSSSVSHDKSSKEAGDFKDWMIEETREARLSDWLAEDGDGAV